MKKSIIAIAISLFFSFGTNAQIPNPVGFPDGVKVGTSTSNGMFTPPLKTTAQINALTGMQMGMVVYDTDEKCLKSYNGTAWICNTLAENQSVVSTSAIKVGTATSVSFFNVKNEIITTDNSTIVVGTFTGSITLGNTTLTSAGGQDIFMVKYNTSNAVQWAFRIGGAGNGSTLIGDEFVYDIIQEQGTSNFYLTGIIYSSNVTGALNVSAVNGMDGFLAKFDGSGTPIWYKLLNGTGSASYDGFANMCALGTDVYVHGYQAGYGILGSTNLSSAASNFIAKYNSSGTLQWVTELNNFITDIKTTSTKVIATGGFSSSITLGSTTYTSVGLQDIFVASFDNTTGTLQWGDTFGSTGNDYPRGVVVKNSKAVVVGDYTGFITWGNTSINRLAGTDTYIAQYDLNGNKEWMKSINGAGNESIIDAKTDLLGNIYLLGSMGQQASFENVSINTSNSANTFVAKLNPNGICIWAKKYFSPLPLTGGGLSQIILVNGLPKFNVSGTFQGTNILFGQSTLTSVNPNPFLATITEN